MLGNVDPQSQGSGIRERVVKTDVLELSVSVFPKYCFRCPLSLTSFQGNRKKSGLEKIVKRWLCSKLFQNKY